MDSVKAQQVPLLYLSWSFRAWFFYEDDHGAPAPLPFVNVAVKGTNRGAASDYDGFFSLLLTWRDRCIFDDRV